MAGVRLAMLLNELFGVYPDSHGRPVSDLRTLTKPRQDETAVQGIDRTVAVGNAYSNPPL